MMFTHQREVWQDPKLPVTGPAFQPARIGTVVIHYTAADDLIDGDPGEHANSLPAYMRSMQRSYVTTRGYSLGYNVAVDWLGGTWEIRGIDFRCAANKGHNERTFAVLALVDGNDMATPQASAAIRRIVAELEALCKRELAIVGHGQLRDPNAATACPGSGLRSQIALGEFSPRWNPAPIVPTPPTEEADDMPAYLHLITPNKGEWLWTPGGEPQPFKTPSDRDKILTVVKATRTEVSDAQLVALQVERPS